MAKEFPENAKYTLPGLTDDQGNRVASILQDRLWALNDLQLVLKHAHWNVVGRNFISVHEMIDPQVDEVRAAVDAVAERIAALGYSPDGRAGALVEGRRWDDYSVRRAGVYEHLGALDVVYIGVIEDHRRAIDEVGEIDKITEDLLISQTGGLEAFQWFVRAHLESTDGDLATSGATTEKGAAQDATQDTGVPA